MNSVKYVGMDVHKGITVIVVLNAAGYVESRTQVKTKAENFRDFFRGLSGRVEVVFEEGAHSAWLYQLLKPLVTEVTVGRGKNHQIS
jgi:hypothetical protein